MARKSKKNSGSGIKMLVIFKEIKIYGVSAYGEGNTYGFRFLLKNGFDNVFSRLEGYLFDAVGIVAVEHTHDDGENTDILGVDVIGSADDGCKCTESLFLLCFALLWGERKGRAMECQHGARTA